MLRIQFQIFLKTLYWYRFWKMRTLQIHSMDDNIITDSSKALASELAFAMGPVILTCSSICDPLFSYLCCFRHTHGQKLCLIIVKKSVEFWHFCKGRDDASKTAKITLLRLKKHTSKYDLTYEPYAKMSCAAYWGRHNPLYCEVVFVTFLSYQSNFAVLDVSSLPLQKFQTSVEVFLHEH